jgi:CRP/FNR family transcriptional regulator
MDKYWQISNLDVFTGVPKQDIKRLAPHVRDRTYENRRMLFVPNETIEDIYLVKKGEVSLFHTHNGNWSIFDVLGPGDLFGNFSKDPIDSPYFAEAQAGTRVCKFPVKEFLKIVSSYPDVMLRTMRLLSERITDYETKISMCPAEAKDKVFNELKRYQNKKSHTRMVEQEAEPAVRLTHQKLADLTGLHRVTVTRTLETLAKEERVVINEDGEMRALP